MYLCACAHSLSCVRLFVALWMDCGPPGSFAHGIFQARIPDQVAISSSRRSPQPRAWTRVSCVSCIGRWVLCLCATWEAQHMRLNMVMCWWMVISVSITGWFKIEKYLLQFLWKLRNLLNSMCHLKGRKLLLYTKHSKVLLNIPKRF